VLNRSSPIGMAGGIAAMPAGNSNLGTDLSDDHPISFAYTPTLAATRGELANPAALTGKVKLDAGGQLQCSSCHDAHDNSNGKFLVMSNQGSALCLTCHMKNNWSTSDHKLSGKSWNGVGTNPWPHTAGATVAANGCENCHRPHTAGGKKWLLNYAAEENNCYTCHNGNVAAKNVQGEFAKASIHPVAASTGVHDATEPATVQARHVECQDCHNPHASNASNSLLPGSLIGVRGVDINGAEVKSSTYEYQICLRCHADSSGQPAPRVARQIVQVNTRLEFATTNPSHHAVAGPGRSSKVPSLIAPWTISSTLKCSDCHNNNAGPGAGGVGPKGPHGSTNPTLLERPNALTGTPTAGDLCYKCHSQSVVTREAPHNRSEHLRYGCKACHDPHGISSTQGTTQYNSRLINLSTTDSKAVGTGATAKLYVDTVGRKCYLSCHGESHNGYSY
jgi:predicted CXXCH cytochrome family protein